VSITPTCTALLNNCSEIVVGSLFTVMETFAVVCAPELLCVPVTTYVVVGEDNVGVPEITPVVVLRLIPFGRAGLIE
jgi:hypothetical protein